MASLREIRRKIKSVKSTEQITKAMKMIAAARMRRAQASILSSRPFAARMEEAVRDLAALDASPGVDFEHPFFQPGPAGAAECLILVTADKGLCGAFNTNVLKAGIEWLHAVPKTRVALVEDPEEGIGGPAVPPENAVFNVVGAEKVVSYLITHPAKEVPDLFDRIPEA